MEAVFLHLLNISITAGYIVLAVILLRFLLFKAPKWVHCLLWAVVGLRLALPFSIESIFSLIPSKEPIPSDIMLSPEPQIDTGIGILNNAVNPVIEYSFTPDPATSANPLQIWFAVAALVWIIVLCAMLLWGLLSYLRLRIRVAPSLHTDGNVYLCDRIDTPFILGILRPRIYLPSSLSEADTSMVLSHERAHLSRLDHIWKPLAFLLLSVYWFNPLLWVAYLLFCRDVEKACDQRVIKKIENEERKKYSTVLLNCSIRRFTVSACPLAFGEVGVKSRIKAVLNYKKPAFWLIIVAIILCIALAVTFLTMPIDRNIGNTDSDAMTAEQRYLMDTYPEYFGLDATNGLDVYVWMMAENDYVFGILEHSKTPRQTLDPELLSLRGLRSSHMRLVLSTYTVDEDDVYIIPWQNPVSSYIGPFWVVETDTSMEETMEKYLQNVREILFGEPLPTVPTYSIMMFDVDGDGTVENCRLGAGWTAGRFSFTFTAFSPNDYVDKKYYNVIYSDVYQLSFVKCDDGIVRVQGIDRYDRIHLFDISIVDDNVHLTENGVPIGEIANSGAELIYSAPPYSYVMSEKQLPKISVEGDCLDDGNSGLPIGSVTKVTLSRSDFDDIMGKYGFKYRRLASSLRKNNVVTYQVTSDDPQVIDLLYIMYQKDNSVLLVYGHDINDGKEIEIRWIYRVR